MESFDVFDTILTRVVGSPASVFVLMGNRLARRAVVSVLPSEFASRRIAAESRARRRHGWGEVTLEMIHRELSADLKLTDAERENMMRLECEVESQLVCAVPGAAQLVEEARQRNGGVIFVSDMYLPQSVIHAWLEVHGIWREGDRLYVSNEMGVSKASGKLFERVLAAEGVPNERLTHRGNDRHGDMATPARMGIRLNPFPDGNLNRYESLMESHSASTGGLSSVLAGASRLARLSRPAVDETERTIRDISAGVLAPILVGYVLWVLRRAQEQSLRRLYFLARDGQILLEIARRLQPRLNMHLDLRYLHASRQSWHLPGIGKIDGAALEWICMKFDFLSIRSLFFRVGITPDEVAGEIARADLGDVDPDRQLTLKELERIKELLRDGPVHDLILARAAAKRKVLLGYLLQEGVIEGSGWALVDVGWNGRLQASLGEILEAASGPVPRGFYFALASRPAAPSAGACEAYLFDPSSRGYRQQCSRVDVPTLMEIACAADHASVDGFVATSGRFEPTLRTDGNAKAIAWGLPIMQDSIRRFSDHVALDTQLLDLSQDLRPVTVDLMRAFWESPTRLEAETWGRFPFENDQSATGVHPIACAYTAASVLRGFLGQPTGRPSHSFWRDGSIAISPPAIRTALRTTTKLRQLLRDPLAPIRRGRGGF
jgi:FMN phosphatase YigB (HAD superfamily)